MPADRPQQPESLADRLRAAILDIDAHATPLGHDEDGFVTGGYLVSVGAMHRALGVAQGAAAVLREVPANPLPCATCHPSECAGCPPMPANPPTELS